MDEEKARFEALKKIRDEVVNFKDSPLTPFRIKPIIGEGNHFASIMLIGEAPGKNESETGHPFCGASGRILDELLASISLPREEVYITNILKDRPPNNRDPLPSEIEMYAPWLDRQIEIIKPKILGLLGRFSMGYIMERYELKNLIEPISRAHGRVYEADFKFGMVKIVPLYHPAVAVYNANMKEELIKDFKVLKELI
ncbi:MAG: uracil-DNA glycosylase [Candidatus Liptonbacteria bacterium CG11_big_fil_rev_8_21_14_0_20_35_14]|uniref:Type-4 uracil-DNA glycosylase n=1 Tax=Candidatus Liptonbacteria bacterium CG11_big_fil_rev_8_21_14_0_20_35_14 TaxID=1974634 RepID=A0A2H0N809_9BACT|nr:MAG: uracil-DNA glycosylase [Candidatus Liptonbacteria bacterium CG11_big_fil_rev_8_21_14_0_20_35_14]